MNGVKPSQGKSNQLRQGVKVVVKAAKIAGLGSDFSWHPRWHYLNLGASYVQIKSDKFTYIHLWSAIWGKYFFIYEG